MDTPTFTKHADGRVTVDQWPAETAISAALLADVRAGQHVPRICVVEEHLDFDVDNGRARYRMVGADDLELVTRLDLVEGEIYEATA